MPYAFPYYLRQLRGKTSYLSQWTYSNKSGILWSVSEEYYPIKQFMPAGPYEGHVLMTGRSL